MKTKCSQAPEHKPRFLPKRWLLALFACIAIATASYGQSGSCGDNLTWTLSSGTLTISGTGAMTDYSYSPNNAPWYSYRSQITKVIITNGVTNIGSYAFSDCSSLTSVTIPSSVVSIGDYAFYKCSSLASISIPSSVTSIGKVAFYGCSSLTSVIIPSSVTSIGGSAFSDCSSLASVTIPESVTSIGDYAFNNCSSLASISIPSSVTSIGLATFVGCSSLTSVTIPSSVTSIGSSAFSGCSGLTSITIPSSVASIGNFAFNDCKSLTSICSLRAEPPTADSNTFSNVSNSKLHVPAGSKAAYAAANGWKRFTNIEEILSGNCGDNLTWTLIDGTLTISGTGAMTDNNTPWYANRNDITTVVVENGVTSIGINAFRYCYSLTSITLPASVTSIGSYAFSDCSSLASITIPVGVTTIGNHAFSDCSNLASVTISEGVTSIGGGAFSDCRALASIYSLCTKPPTADSNTFSNVSPDCKLYVPMGSKAAYAAADGWKGFTNIQEMLSGNCGANLIWTLNNGTLTISGTGTMTDYTANNTPWHSNKNIIRTVIINSDVTSIGSSAFAGCSSLTSITIPANVTSIGEEAFYACSALTSIYSLRIAPPTAYSNTFTNVSPNCKLYVPTGKKAVYTAADGWKGFTNIQEIRGTCGNNLIWTLSDSNSTLTIGGTGTMSNYSSSSIPWNSYRSQITNVEINSGVTSIGNYAFYNCKNLISITIPESVTTIGNYAFSGYNSSLTTITIPIGVTSIGNEAFSNCNSLTSILIPSNVTSIGGGAFSSCSNLTSVTILEGVTSIGSAAFSNCSSLTSVSIPSSVTTIESNTFYDCSKLASVTIPEGLTSIGSAAFSNCSSLTSVSIPSSVTTIEDYTFSGCSSLTSVTILEGVTSIGGSAFSNCSSLTSITIPAGVTTIESNTFDDCSKLASVTIPESVTTIGGWAFWNCSSLASITIPKNVTSIGEYAFSGCISLMDIYSLSVFPPKVTSNTFSEVNKSACTLHVPVSSKQTYWVADGWKEFFNIEEDAPSGVNVPLAATGVSLYPNPLHDMLYIRSASAVRVVSIFDTAGNMIIAESPYTGSISVATLPRGIYLVKIQTEDGMVTRRMMKE